MVFAFAEVVRQDIGAITTIIGKVPYVGCLGRGRALLMPSYTRGLRMASN